MKTRSCCQKAKPQMGESDKGRGAHWHKVTFPLDLPSAF